MATRSSVLAQRIPWTEEPGGLPFMGLHRVGHDYSDLAAAAVQPSLLGKLRPSQGHIHLVFEYYLTPGLPEAHGSYVYPILQESHQPCSVWLR